MIPAIRGGKSRRRGGATLQRQKMNKSGTDSTANAVVQGWASDSTSPATIVSNELEVVGASPRAFIRVPLTWRSSTNTARIMNIEQNGNILVAGRNQRLGTSNVNNFLGWIGAVMPGDKIRLTRTAASGTIVDVGTSLSVEPIDSAPKIIKNGDQTVNVNGTIQIVGWSPDSTDPATITNDALIAPSAGVGHVMADLKLANVSTTFGRADVQLRVNGNIARNVEISDNSGCVFGFPDYTFAAGDAITLTVVRAGSPTILSGSTIQLFMDRP
ncbi:hypothetical protein SEA_CAMERICO_29 [Gordonia phage Camerico]|nr:hypothetical protein SEA_CAMERICO_29 [Gordonia phage Camerico]